MMKIIVGILTNVLHFTDYARLDAVANYEKMCEIHAKFREALSLLLKGEPQSYLAYHNFYCCCPFQ